MKQTSLRCVAEVKVPPGETGVFACFYNRGLVSTFMSEAAFTFLQVVTLKLHLCGAPAMSNAAWCCMLVGELLNLEWHLERQSLFKALERKKNSFHSQLIRKCRFGRRP